MRPEILIGDLPAVIERLSKDFLAESERALGSRGFFAVALPGGSVAVNAFPVLAKLRLNWGRVDFFWVDERAVPPSDSESNFALAHALWFMPAEVPARSIHRMPADLPDLGAAAAAYAVECARALGPSLRFDYVLLGVGPDGHVASLFPGAPGLLEERQSVLAVTDSPKPPARRLTLTIPALANSERLVVMAFGESKAEALRRALVGQDAMSPLAVLLRRATRPLVLADPTAAMLIGRLE
jgi:6-phosphogluconolactonase